MRPKILLLECTDELANTLLTQGFDVVSGTTGFCTGIRSLPLQIYETDVVIYNPSKSTTPSRVVDQTPDFSLAHDLLKDHVARGASWLIFVNRVSEDPKTQRQAYGWLPFVVPIGFTRDVQVSVAPVNSDRAYMKPYMPLLTPEDLKLPVLHKLDIDYEEPLFLNKKGEALGAVYHFREGRVLTLPQYQSNETAIGTFLDRVLPQIHGGRTHGSLVDNFLSPSEKTLTDRLEGLRERHSELQAETESVKVDRESARRAKIKIIEADETATLILRYLELARRQEDVALFYLYKVTEAIEQKLGGEKFAKDRLACNAEFNLIGKLANASYGDIRHAPKPGEKVRKWSTAEIGGCFDSAQKIMMKYFHTLF